MIGFRLNIPKGDDPQPLDLVQFLRKIENLK